MTATVEARIFRPEQIAGLKEVGCTFSIDVVASSVDQLLNDRPRPPFHGYHESEQMRAVVPVARQVAVNPNILFIEGSQGVVVDGYEELHQQLIEDQIREFRKRNLKNGTLEGIDFGKDHISVYAQLDFEYQRQFGRVLIKGGYVWSIDHVTEDPVHGSLMAYVGRHTEDQPLSVHDFFIRHGCPAVAVMLVATPVGER